MTSLPSPLQGSDSPIPGTTQPNTNILVNNSNAGVAVSVGQNTVYRPTAAQGSYVYKLTKNLMSNTNIWYGHNGTILY